MLRVKLLYAALVIGLASFYVLYIDYLPLVLLICALVLPLILKAGLVWLHFRADASIECSSASCTADSRVPVTVVVNNRCPLWFSAGVAKIRVTHGFGAGRESFRIRFPLQSRNTSRLTFHISAKSCGIVTAELQSVRVYDVFRLLHTGIRRSEQQVSLLVLPKPLDIPLDTSAPPVEDPESSQYADRPGDDPSELFGIREYQPGDPVSRIHWKLSSRSDALYLKEFGAPIDKHTLLLVEYCPPVSDTSSMEDAGALLTVLYSLAWALTVQHHPCTIAWYDTSRDEVMRCPVQDEAALTEAFRSLYDAMYEIGNEDAALRYALGSEQFSSAVLLTNLPGTQMLNVLEYSVSANHRSVLVIGQEPPVLESDETDIFHVLPADPMIVRLIV
jgi:uncharacterized protein (DUF58 family)